MHAGPCLRALQIWHKIHAGQMHQILKQQLMHAFLKRKFQRKDVYIHIYINICEWKRIWTYDANFMLESTLANIHLKPHQPTWVHYILLYLHISLTMGSETINTNFKSVFQEWSQQTSCLPTLLPSCGNILVYRTAPSTSIFPPRTPSLHDCFQSQRKWGGITASIELSMHLVFPNLAKQKKPLCLEQITHAWFLLYWIHTFHRNHDADLSENKAHGSVVLPVLRLLTATSCSCTGFGTTFGFRCTTRVSPSLIVLKLYMYGILTSDCTLPVMSSSSSPGCSTLQLESSNLSVVLTNHAGEMYPFEAGADKKTLCISPWETVFTRLNRLNNMYIPAQL